MCTRKKPLCSFGSVSHTIMAEPDAALRKTMQTSAPWERKK